MAGLLKRIQRVSQAELNSWISQTENPAAMTGQTIADLKRHLDASYRAYAEVRAAAIQTREDARHWLRTAKEYEQKAITLLQRAQTGRVDDQEADRLAAAALQRKVECEKQAEEAKVAQYQMEVDMKVLDENIETLKYNIDYLERELDAIKALSKIERPHTPVETQTYQAAVDELGNSGAEQLLERMKHKIERDAILAEEYDKLIDDSDPIDKEIESVLGDDEDVKAKQALEALKKRISKHRPDDDLSA